MAWTDFILPAAAAVGGYFDYKDRQDRKDQAKEQYDAMVAADKASFLQSQANRGGGRSGGGGGGGRSKQAMIDVLNKYYAQSNAMLQPYADAAALALPQMTANFNKGNELMAPTIQSVLSPEYINSILTYQAPQEMKLPEYLKGGGK
jgi:hypothetical protein